mgnify:CR=1 FL=1
MIGASAPPSLHRSGWHLMSSANVLKWGTSYAHAPCLPGARQAPVSRLVGTGECWPWRSPPKRRMAASMPPMLPSCAAQYPASAAVFDGMAMEEDEHRRRLIGVYKRRFGDLIVPLRREHIADFYTRRPVWLVENLGLDRIRDEAADMEREAREFYAKPAAGRSIGRSSSHAAAGSRRRRSQAPGRRRRTRPAAPRPRRRGTSDLTSRRRPILTWIQPGLAGLMDGSVSDPGADLRDCVRRLPKPVDGGVSGGPVSFSRRRHLYGFHGSGP